MRPATLIVLFLAAVSSVAPQPRASAAPSSYEVVHGWPQLPDGFAFGQVSGVGVDSHSHVFVFHRGDRPIMCFEGATGKLVASWGDGMFATAHGLAVDDKDNVWVTDVDHHQVYKFSHDGVLLMTVGAKDAPGLDGKHFNKPTDVAVASSGDFYVSDGYGNSRVAKFNARGEFLLDWGTKGDQPGEFDTPHGISLDAAGRVYVADRGNARVQVFDGSGKFLAQWKSAELGRPWDVFIGSDGYAYVLDGGDMNPKPPDRGRMLKLDLSGHILETWGRFGKYDGEIYWGHALATARNGDVYVTDVNVGMRVQKFARQAGR